MRLSAKPLKNVIDVNHLVVSNQVYARALDNEIEATDLYFQLIDLDQNDLRYMPEAGSTLSLTLPALDDELEVTRVATQPFANDTSIWKVSLLAGDQASSGNLIFAFTDTSGTKRFVVQNGLIIENVDQGGCC